MFNMSNEKTYSGDHHIDLTTYRAGILQATAHRLLQKACDDILKPYGITKAQWLIIGTVFDAGSKGVRLTELAKTLDTTMAYITVAVNLLESKKMLLRVQDKNDSRAKLITVHPSFKKTCTKIERSLRDGLRELVYRDVSAEDFKVYIKVLGQLSDLNI